MYLNLLTLCIIALFLSACTSRNPDSANTTVSHQSGPQVPEGYIVEKVAGAGLVDFPMFSTLDETGRLFVFESIGDVYNKTQDAIDNPQFRIKLLVDTTGDGVYDKMTVYADSVGFPQGGVFIDGSLYASSAPDLLKLTDVNNDGVADKREVILTGWTLNVNANSLVGPVLAPDGWLYMNNAIEGFDVTSKEGVQMKGETARMWRVKPDGSLLEWVSAGGMNNPVEITFTAASEPIGTETYFTDPKAGERDALVYWVEGGVYPKPNGNIARDQLVRTGDLMPVVSKYSRVAPSGICSYRSTAFGEDFNNNLFSAQFNTHRVLRHKLFRQGASFRTEDEIFFWNDHEDFHPTDVLEDADGSLLIVETGGWFLKGCPLSQVSKPELKGAIYRVRKKDAEKIDDPYGNKITWTSAKPETLAELLGDHRPFVNDRALGALAKQKEKAAQALANTIHSEKSPAVRTRAIFALYRGGSEQGRKVIRESLTDRETDVLVAAARCAGLAKDTGAVNALVQIIRTSQQPAAKRQAATALGQIGAASAVDHLLHSAAGNTDRFVSHAIIYSLVQLNSPAGTRTGLTNADARVKEAALTALDQMPGSPVTFSDVTTFLSGDDSLLQQRALWVVSHHPGWSGNIISFLDKKIDDSLSAGETQLVKSILVSFAGEPRIQRFMADKLDAGTNSKKMILDAMSSAALEKFPAVWVNALSRQLSTNTDGYSKANVIELIQLRRIKKLDQQLEKIAADKNYPASLRIQAIAALKRPDKTLSTAHFSFLCEQIRDGGEASLRQQAAGVLETANLDEQQVTWVAKTLLPEADAYLLPRIIPLFHGEHSVEVGRSVAATLQRSPGLDGFSQEAIIKLFEKYPPGLKPHVDSLLILVNQKRATRLEQLKQYEAVLDEGVIDRGRVLFFGKATCSTCHTVGSEGGHMGPDLTSIQRDRSVHDLLEAVVYPSASFVREFETFKIKTATGEHLGIIKTKSPESIILSTSPQSSVSISRDEIISTEMQDLSMMPQGLDKLLTKQEMADLIVFLLGQDQDPETDAKILRHTSSGR